MILRIFKKIELINLILYIYEKWTKYNKLQKHKIFKIKYTL